jgi:hypothetical protein
MSIQKVQYVTGPSTPQIIVVEKDLTPKYVTGKLIAVNMFCI